MFNISYKGQLYCAFDMIESLSFSQKANYTQNPIEQGSYMSDHMFLGLDRYTINAVVSIQNTAFNPIFGSNAIEATTNGLKALLEQRIVFPLTINYAHEDFVIKNAIIDEYTDTIEKNSNIRIYEFSIVDILISDSAMQQTSISYVISKPNLKINPKVTKN